MILVGIISTAIWFPAVLLRANIIYVNKEAICIMENDCTVQLHEQIDHHNCSVRQYCIVKNVSRCFSWVTSISCICFSIHTRHYASIKIKLSIWRKKKKTCTQKLNLKSATASMMVFGESSFQVWIGPTHSECVCVCDWFLQFIPRRWESLHVSVPKPINHIDQAG